MKEASTPKVASRPKPLSISQVKPFERFDKKPLVIAGICLLVYLLWLNFFVGFRSDHVVLLGILGTTFFASANSRKILYGFLPFVVYWILYDSMRVYPNYLVNEVNILGPRELEKMFFGIQTDTGILTPNEYLALHRNSFFDVVGPMFYLCWVPVPLLYMVYLFFYDKRLMIEFSIAFLLVNIIGIMGYYLYPAAPPWYYELHGDVFIANTPGNAAGLLNFDQFFNINLFEGMYNKNANVFAAVPSLHAAFPLVLSYYGWKKGLKVATSFFIFIATGIWLTAVYTNHHYIIDLLAGAFCAFLAILVLELTLKNSTIKNKFNQYVSVVKD